MSSLQTTQQNFPVLPEDLEQVLLVGNLATLKPEQRVQYYKGLCESLGLNPLTKPFDYMVLKGRTVLYAKKDATDQLRRIWSISTRIVKREVFNDVFVVTAQGKMLEREDEAIGAVPIKGLAGEALANAFMKAETKAKRRLTLSICGLGFTDESEVKSIKDVELKKYDGELKDMNTLLAGDTRKEEQVQHVETPEENTVDTEKEKPKEPEVVPKEQDTTPSDPLPEEPVGDDDFMNGPEPSFEGPVEEEPKEPKNHAPGSISQKDWESFKASCYSHKWKNEDIGEMMKKLYGHQEPGKLRSADIDKMGVWVKMSNKKPRMILDNL